MIVPYVCGLRVTSENEDDPSHSVVTIDIEGRLLKCDRKILVKHSKYFQALFAFHRGSGEDKNKKLVLDEAERGQDQQAAVKLRGGIDYESGKAILSAMSGADVVVNGENAQAILQASTFLQCALAEKAAADYMLSNLNLANAFSVFLLGLNCGSVYLAEKAEDFILRRVQTFHRQVSNRIHNRTINF